MGIEKIIVGIILVIIGLWLILPAAWCQSLATDFKCMEWYHDLVTVIKGFLPAFLIFVGAVLVWIESEEMRMQRPKRRR